VCSGVLGGMPEGGNEGRKKEQEKHERVTGIKNLSLSSSTKRAKILCAYKLNSICRETDWGSNGGYFHQGPETGKLQGVVYRCKEGGWGGRGWSDVVLVRVPVNKESGPSSVQEFKGVEKFSRRRKGPYPSKGKTRGEQSKKKTTEGRSMEKVEKKEGWRARPGGTRWGAELVVRCKGSFGNGQKWEKRGVRGGVKAAAVGNHKRWGGEGVESRGVGWGRQFRVARGGNK